MCQIMFEKYKVPAVFISKNAVPPPSRTNWTRRVPHPVLIGHAASLSQVLSAFSCGRSTAVVLDSGGGTTCVAPVHDGSACLPPAPGRSVNT